MWVTISKAGNTEYHERYTNPLTGKAKVYTVPLKGDKDTAQKRKLAVNELEKKHSSTCKEARTEKITLTELMDKYLVYQEKTVKPSTLKRNKIILGIIVPLIGDDIIVDNLTAGYVKEKLLSRTNNPVTLNSYIKVFKAMLHFAFESDHLKDTQIFDKLKKFKIDKSTDVLKPEDKYLEQDQLLKVLDYMKHSQEQWYLLTKFLVLSGMRIGEAIALNKSDIGADEITINKTYDTNNHTVGAPKTAASNRQIYIQPELAEVVKEITRYHRNNDILTGSRSDLFFHNDKGEYISYGAYNKYVRETTIKVLGERRTPHSFRHTHASLLFGEGVTIDSISRRLGHDNSKITQQIYLHIVEKIKEKDREIIRSKTLLKVS